MHLPSVHQLLLCAADEKDNFKGKRGGEKEKEVEKRLDGSNFMHNDDLVARQAGPRINNRKCRSFRPEFKCRTICNCEKLISLTCNAVMFRANGSKVELSRQPAKA